MANYSCANLSQLRQIPSGSLSNLDKAYVGSLRSIFIWVNNEAAQDDNQTVIIPDNQPPSGRWICPRTASIPNQTVLWDNVDKTGSSLDDLDERSASSLNDGTLFKRRLPSGVPYFDTPSPSLILQTDQDGKFILAKAALNQLSGLLPFAKIDWSMFTPDMIGAESTIYFDPNQFNIDDQNHISVKTMTDSIPGIAIPGVGIHTNGQGSIEVIYGTGSGEALEGSTPLEGDVDGTHASNTVNALRSIPLTFFFNDLEGKDGYVITLNAKNHNTPFFHLSPAPKGGGGSTIAFAINSFVISITSLEVGQVGNPTFTASYNSDVISATLSDSDGNDLTLNEPFTSFHAPTNDYSKNTVGSVVFTLSAVGSDSTTQTKTQSLSWKIKKFYGVLPEQSDGLTAINALQSSELVSDRVGNFSVVPGALDYIYFACPSEFGVPVMGVGGFCGGFFREHANVSVTNEYGVTTLYDVYRSDNLNLGNTTVSVN